MKKLHIVAMILVLAVLAGGAWYAYESRNQNQAVPGQTETPVNTDEPDYTIEHESLSLEFTYSDEAGVYIYAGTVQKPTPCHEVEVDSKVQESFPERVELNIDIVDSGDICAQLIEEEEISGQFIVSEQAKIQVIFNSEVLPVIDPTTMPASDSN